MSTFFADYPVQGGVTSLNGLTGALTLIAGSGITITPSGSNITISSTGGTGANTSLSNLTTTAINQSLVPNSNGSLNLGSGSDMWNGLFVSQILSVGGTGGQIDVFDNLLEDSSGKNSINWNSRILYDNTNVAQLSWSILGVEFHNSFLMDGATSGQLTQLANSTTTSYSITWPAAQGGAGTVLTNDGAGNLSWGAGGGGGGANTSLSNLTTTAINQDLNVSGNKVTGVSELNNKISTPQTISFTGGSSPPIYLNTDPMHPNEINVTGIGLALPTNTPFTFTGSNLPAPFVANTTYYSSGGGVGTGLGQNSIVVWTVPNGSATPITSLGSGSIQINYSTSSNSTLAITSNVDASTVNITASSLLTNGISQIGQNGFVVDIGNLQLENTSFNPVLQWGNQLLIDSSNNNSVDWTNRQLLGNDGTTVQASWTTSGFTIGANTSSANTLNTTTATTGSNVLTLTNAPSSVSGNPSGYISITINGTVRVIPFW